ncbi:MAG: hypothetical protein Q8O04_12490 [Deltaproteobacteria bacterium]|nr:hypothetical protein [Deltaproteobacteria bacterium]
MRKTWWILPVICLLLAIAPERGVCGQTIVAREVEGYFYSEGKMEKTPGQFENTYYYEGNTIKRVKVHDFKNKSTEEDDTVYHVQRQLLSDPGINISLSEPVIRAIGQPGMDAVEILVVGEKYIQAVKSTSSYFVISRFKRIK